MSLLINNSHFSDISENLIDVSSCKYTVGCVTSTWMSIAGAKVCVTLAAMEKSPVVTIL